MSAISQIASRDFGRKVVCALARKGVIFVGLQAIPCSEVGTGFLQSIRAYKIDDNGCGRVLTYHEILALV